MSLDGGGGFEVCDGAGETENAVVGAGAEFQAVDDFAQHGHVLWGRRGILAHECRGHLGITRDARVLAIALFLNLTGCDDALSDGCRGFAGFSATKLVETQRGYFNLNINAVEQGTTDLVQVFMDLSRRTLTGLGGVVVIAAGAGVHRSDEHKVAGVFDAVLGTCDGDFSVFQWLAQHFKGCSRELW